MLTNELVGDACMERHQVSRDTECTTIKPMHTRGTKMQPYPLTKRTVIRNFPPSPETENVFQTSYLSFRLKRASLRERDREITML